MSEKLAGDVSFTKSRVFIQDPTFIPWQLLSLEQSKRDGSIYLKLNEFKDIEWLTAAIESGKIVPYKFKQDNNKGHLSFHGHGQAHIKGEGQEYKLPISGQYLLKKEENSASLRHLFTLLPIKPDHIPNSQALNRPSDQLFSSINTLKPFVVMAFALPKVELDVNFQMSMKIDDLDEIPGMLGFHIFPLVYHNIFMVLYRTKHMDEWPQKSMLQYFDGVNVPVFIGKPERSLQVEVRIPEYKLKNNKLTISV